VPAILAISPPPAVIGLIEPWKPPSWRAGLPPVYVTEQ
jgi:hypothetical protein